MGPPPFDHVLVETSLGITHSTNVAVLSGATRAVAACGERMTLRSLPAPYERNRSAPRAEGGANGARVAAEVIHFAP